MPSTHLFTPDEHAVAIIASNILLQPVNQISRMTFSAACRSAVTLLVSAKRALAEPVSEEPPQQPTRAEYKRPARAADIIPPAVRVTE